MPIPFTALKQTARLAKAIDKSGAVSTTVEGIARYTGGPELQHISLEYLLSMSVLPLSCIIHIFGAEGCGKSTLALDLLNRYFLRQGCDGRLIDTEAKLSTTLVNSIVDADAQEDHRFMIRRAPSQEAAQGVVTAELKELSAATFGTKHDENPHMLGLIVDSFRVVSQQTQDKIAADGHATKQFAIEANLWRPFLSTTSSNMMFSPVSLILVNHMTEKEAAYGKVKDHGGGMALKFYETYSILLSKIGSHRTKTESYTDLTLQTYKNSNGPDRQKISPRIVYKHPDLDPDKVRVDWDIADARFLSGPDIPREALKKAGVCNTKESSKAGLYSDDVLGLTCVPIQEITQAIYSDPEKLAALRKELSITRGRTLEELFEDGWFFKARAAMEDSDE